MNGVAASRALLADPRFALLVERAEYALYYAGSEASLPIIDLTYGMNQKNEIRGPALEIFGSFERRAFVDSYRPPNSYDFSSDKVRYYHEWRKDLKDLRIILKFSDIVRVGETREGCKIGIDRQSFYDEPIPLPTLTCPRRG